MEQGITPNATRQRKAEHIKDTSHKITHPFNPSHSYCILATNKYLFKLAPSWRRHLAKTGPSNIVNFSQLPEIRRFSWGIFFFSPSSSLLSFAVAGEMPAAAWGVQLIYRKRTSVFRFAEGSGPLIPLAMKWGATCKKCNEV